MKLLFNKLDMLYSFSLNPKLLNITLKKSETEIFSYTSLLISFDCNIVYSLSLQLTLTILEF